MAVTANIAPMMYTPDSLANNIALTGMGSDSIRSLSFAWYKLAYVLNTLPNIPMVNAIIDIIAMYIQSSPAEQSGSHTEYASIPNMAPIQPCSTAT